MRPPDRVIRLLKMSVAAGLSWYLASLISPHRNPYFAPLAVVVVFQTTVADTLTKAWYRLAGILGGAAIALLVMQWLHVGAVTIALTVLLGTAIFSALHFDPQIISQVGVTVVMVLASSGTPHYAEYRLFETLLGTVVAVVINAAIMPPNGLPLAERRVREVADLLVSSLLQLSRAPSEAMVEPLAKQIEQQMGAAAQALQAAEASFKLNPFAQAGRDRLRELKATLSELEKIGIQVRGIARALADMGPHVHLYWAGLSQTVVETAEAVAAYRRALESSSGDASRSLATAVTQARRSQGESLIYLKEAATLADLRDLSAVLADLDRILSEVSPDHGGLRSPVAVNQSVAFGHD